MITFLPFTHTAQSVPPPGGTELCAFCPFFASLIFFRATLYFVFAKNAQLSLSLQ